MTVGQRVEAVRAEIEKWQRRSGVGRDGILTRARLARLLEIDRSTVTKWATDKDHSRVPRNIERVAEVMGVSVAELFAGRLDKKRKGGGK